MPYQTIWEQQGVFWKYSGIITNEDIVHSNNEFYGNPRSEDANYQLVDGTKIEKLKIDLSSVELLAATDYACGLSLKKLKVAFVSVRPEISELFEAYIDFAIEYNCKWECKIFNDLAAAREWALS
jgi:hypothetical protein